VYDQEVAGKVSVPGLQQRLRQWTRP
jgi:hypothetical protein